MMAMNLKTLSLAVISILSIGLRAQGAEAGRERLLMDSDWRFALGHAQDRKSDFGFGEDFWSFLAKQNMGKSVMGPLFDDSAWKIVQLPHDWAMELPFTPEGEWHRGSRPLGRDFPATSVGWYRKQFDIPAGDKGRRMVLEFDGVNRNCMVFVNGILQGSHASAYTSFQFDVTDAIRYGEKNVVAVRVDATLNEGWWYEGAGIYRHVWLTKTAPIHVAQWGTQVIAKDLGEVAQVTARTSVQNESDEAAQIVVHASVIDAAGQTVATAATAPGRLESAEQREFMLAMDVAHPRLWSLESPNMYRLVATVKWDGVEVDRTETPFGIRTIKFDPDRGFFLNGKPVKIKGFCDHQQHAGIGVAIPDALWSWRVMKLKEMGGNAIRMAHNPSAPEFLDACDRMGMLVMAEQRLFSSGEEGLRQLDSLVRRDRNHPSIVIWSAGNEEKALENKEASGPIMETLQKRFHRLDPTRPVTYGASNGGYLLGANKVADIRGINYFDMFKRKPDETRVATVEEYHAKYPRQPIVVAEESVGGREFSWQFTKEHDYLSGIFYWTGFGYFGETKWPNISGWGALDLCGFPRGDAYWFFRQEWAGKGPRPVEEPGDSAVALVCEADRTSIKADGEDVAVVTISIVDAKGRRMAKANLPIEVNLSGPGRVLTLVNSDDRGHELPGTTRCQTYAGRAQALLQATRDPGAIRMEVKSEGLRSATLTIDAAPCTPRAWVP